MLYLSDSGGLGAGGFDCDTPELGALGLAAAVGGDNFEGRLVWPFTC